MIQSWKREHRIGFWVAVVLGAALGLVIGYKSHRYYSQGIDVWIGNDGGEAVIWAVLGAVIAGAIVYLLRTSRA